MNAKYVQSVDRSVQYEKKKYNLKTHDPSVHFYITRQSPLQWYDSDVVAGQRTLLLFFSCNTLSSFIFGIIRSLKTVANYNKGNRETGNIEVLLSFHDHFPYSGVGQLGTENFFYASSLDAVLLTSNHLGDNGEAYYILCAERTRNISKFPKKILCTGENCNDDTTPHRAAIVNTVNYS